jgi:hypothetical protein
MLDDTRSGFQLQPDLFTFLPPQSRDGSAVNPGSINLVRKLAALSVVSDSEQGTIIVIKVHRQFIFA